MSDQSFEAELHHPKIQGGSAKGRIQLDVSCVRFEPSSKGTLGNLGALGTSTWELPLTPQLELRLGGAADDMVFFSDPGQPGVVLIVRDTRVLDHSALGALPGLGRALGKAKRQRSWLAVSLWTAGLLSLVLVLGLLFGAGWLVSWAVDKIPEDLEIELGRTAIEAMKTNGSFVEDPEVARQVDQLMEPLRRSVDGFAYPFEVHVVADPAVNAFALPGGQIVLNSGLIQEAGSVEEIQAILAHEMAHVTRRHSLRAVLRTIGFYSLAQIVFGDAGVVLEMIGQSGAELATLSSSRDQELEADEVGWEHLQRAKINPEALSTFLRRLESSGFEFDLLSTHPATSDRIDRLIKKSAQGSGAAQGDGPAQSSVDLEAFQASVERAVAAMG